MGEPKGTAKTEASPEEPQEELDQDQDPDAADGAAPQPQPPPRRRLVAELLEGQEQIAETAKSGLQLVATPVHVQPADAAQPVYQLDLSSAEPAGTMLEPDPVGAAVSRATEAGEDSGLHAAAVPSNAPVDDVRGALRQMITRRDRRLMAAERDGISAYELAAGVDDFVDAILEIVHTYEG